MDLKLILVTKLSQFVSLTIYEGNRITMGYSHSKVEKKWNTEKDEKKILRKRN